MNIETERQRREGDWTERKTTKKERQGRYLQREIEREKERDKNTRNRETKIRERERQKYEKERG